MCSLQTLNPRYLKVKQNPVFNVEIRVTFQYREVFLKVHTCMFLHVCGNPDHLN